MKNNSIKNVSIKKASMKKTFVIGDVHGCLEELDRLLTQIQPNLKQDRLVMLGDYIDRGPHSCQVVSKLMQLQQQFGKEHVVLLRGNHEQMAIDYYENGNSCFLYNGGQATLRSFVNNGEDLAHHIDFFQGLPLYFEDDHFIYVHGGIKHGCAMEEQIESDLLWIREEFFLTSQREEKTVIFGHTPTNTITGRYDPFFGHGRIGIDTACVYGGYLTALELERGQVIGVYKERSLKHERKCS